MTIHSHLIEHRGSLASLVVTLVTLVRGGFDLQNRSLAPTRSFVHRMMFERRKGCLLMTLICLGLAWLPVALSQEIDEGEFSRTMLGYKPQLLKNEFEQTEMRSVAGSGTKRLEHVYSKIICLEAEFRCGRYYPDLLDEQIVIIREELRLILATPIKTTSMSEPGFL